MAGLGWFCVLQSQCRVGCKWLFASNSWPADASITPSPQRLLADLLSWPSPCAPYEHSATYSQSKFRFFASTGSSPAAPAVNAQAPKLGWLASGFLRLTGPRISTPALTPTASTGTGTVGQTLAAPSDSQQRLWRPATDCLSCPWICWFGVRGRGTPRLDPASQHGVLRLPTYTHGHIRNQSQIKPRARDEPTNACTTGGAGFAVPSNRYRVRTLYDEQTGRMKPRERITHAAICLIAVPPLSQTAEAGPPNARAMSSQPGKFTGGSVSVVALPVRGTIEATCSLASCLHVDIRAASRVRHAAKTLSRRRVDHARQGHHPTPHLFVSSPLGAHWTRPWLDGDGNDCTILCYVFTCWVHRDGSDRGELQGSARPPAAVFSPSWKLETWTKLALSALAAQPAPTSGPHNLHHREPLTALGAPRSDISLAKSASFTSPETGAHAASLPPVPIPHPPPSLSPHHPPKTPDFLSPHVKSEAPVDARQSPGPPRWGEGWTGLAPLPPPLLPRGRDYLGRQICHVELASPAMALLPTSHHRRSQAWLPPSSSALLSNWWWW
ncbi:hypothetical protein Purlil1_9509 [Purpureocillium lilacinum]|uniref:Uncharacterized protein n=1 Tax=Purpureocillium lilacinum TaxID=33203 RepID=A0ABR0BQF1_PURLI|nr:hypothetical protein Purlil1_9509 [Purpureocillium lilacinum]